MDPAWERGQAPLSRCLRPTRKVNRLGLEGAKQDNRLLKFIGASGLILAGALIFFRGEIFDWNATTDEPQEEVASDATELKNTPPLTVEEIPLEMRVDAHPGEEVPMEIDGGSAGPNPISEEEAIQRHSDNSFPKSGLQASSE